MAVRASCAAIFVSSIKAISPASACYPLSGCQEILSPAINRISPPVDDLQSSEFCIKKILARVFRHAPVERKRKSL